MEVIIKETYEEVSKLAARMIADVIRKKTPGDYRSGYRKHSVRHL